MDQRGCGSVQMESWLSTSSPRRSTNQLRVRTTHLSSETTGGIGIGAISLQHETAPRPSDLGLMMQGSLLYPKTPRRASTVRGCAHPSVASRLALHPRCGWPVQRWRCHTCDLCGAMPQPATPGPSPSDPDPASRLIPTNAQSPR